LPASVDPRDFRSVSIWCKRFAVSFGAAELTRA
ncbi:DM13 domain-containing protein, partial [Micromonospora sp. M51]